MKYRIIYNKPGTINCRYDVEAADAREAVTVFQIENPGLEIVSVEEIPNA
jgi:hypothetical protein